MTPPLFALGALRANWKLIATAGAILTLSLLWWRADSLRAGYKDERDQVRQEYALFREAVTAKAAEALAAQQAVNAAQEKAWREQADEADKSIDDLRARLRLALVRPQAGGSAGSRASATAQADRAGVPQAVPAAASGDSRSVPVDADILAGLAAYAIQAHEWAISLDQSSP